jgi:hypothetical protein
MEIGALHKAMAALLDRGEGRNGVFGDGSNCARGTARFA